MCKHVGKSSCRHDTDTASDEPTRCNVADMVCVVLATQRRHVGMSVVLGGKNPRHDADITSQDGWGKPVSLNHDILTSSQVTQNLKI
jgi:hypothetical protein